MQLKPARKHFRPQSRLSLLAWLEEEIALWTKVFTDATLVSFRQSLMPRVTIFAAFCLKFWLVSNASCGYIPLHRDRLNVYLVCNLRTRYGVNSGAKSGETAAWVRALSGTIQFRDNWTTIEPAGWVTFQANYDKTLKSLIQDRRVKSELPFSKHLLHDFDGHGDVLLCRTEMEKLRAENTKLQEQLEIHEINKEQMHMRVWLIKNSEIGAISLECRKVIGFVTTMVHDWF